MDYNAMAEELLSLRLDSSPCREERRLNGLLQGESLVLGLLAALGRAAHPKDLSQRMQVSSARVAVLLNHLESEGLIIRRTDPADNRQVLAELTPAGKDAVDAYHRHICQILSSMLEALGPEDAEAYLRIQYRLLQIARQTR